MCVCCDITFPSLAFIGEIQAANQKDCDQLAEEQCQDPSWLLHEEANVQRVEMG